MLLKKDNCYFCEHKKAIKKTRIHHQHLNIWERNTRDCDAKVQKIWKAANIFLKKFSRQNEWSDILRYIQMMRRRQLPIMNAI